jgi:hypothetical protein
LTDLPIQQPVSSIIPSPETSAVSVAIQGSVEKPSSMKVIRKLGSAFTPSIKDALSGNGPDNRVQEDSPKTAYSQYEEGIFEDFTQDQLVAKWNEFLGQIADRPSLCSALSNVPELHDGNKLMLKIGNSVQEEDIRLIKPDLVSWLRKELRNSGIELTTQLGKIETGRVIFSDSEKLQMMVQKNPQLFELKQKFNLDFKD